MFDKLVSTNNNWWINVAVHVKNSIVFVDAGAAECLHWNGGILRLVDGGAIKVLDFSTFKMASILTLTSETSKVVFLLTKPLWSSTLDTLENILSSRLFTQCQIITTVHPAVHQLTKYGLRSTLTGPNKDDAYYSVKDQLLTVMGNKNYVLEVHYIPTFISFLSSNLFITPTFADLFPVLSGDFGSIHLEKNVESFMELTYEDLKLETQVTLRNLATNFETLFENANLREDCYSMGFFSRLLCNELEQLPSSKLRKKKNGSRAAVLFIDRTVDLSQATSYDFETLLDKIMYSSKKRPQHTIDVDIDLSPLSFAHKSCHSTDFLVSGSLSNFDNQKSDVLYSMINDKHKDCVMKINRRLVDISPKSASTAGKTSKITAENLLNKVIQFKNDPILISNNHPLLQYVLATVQTLQDAENSKVDQLLGMEKALTQMLAESQSANFALRLAQMIKERKTRALSIEEILIILVHVCAMKDILMETNESEDILKAVLGDAMLRDYAELPEYLKTAIGPEVDEWTIHTTTAKLFKILHAISNSRRDHKKYKCIFDGGNSSQPAVCVPLMKQLLDDIYDPAKPDLVDLECKSGGIKDILKSGFSLFLNVNKPRPSDCPILIIYLIGGVTSTEVRHIKERVAHHSESTEVIVGSTRLASPKDTIKLLFSDLNSIN